MTERIIMRKSERIRQLELEVLRIGMELEFMQGIITALIENNSLNNDLDAGKWYKKPENN